MTFHENLGIGTRVEHAQHGQGVVINEKSAYYTICFIQVGLREIHKTDENLQIMDLLDPDSDRVSLFDVERVLTHVVKKYTDYPEVVEISPKFKGGKLIIKPKDNGLQPKEFPIDTLFNKIIMIRDRLRTLEQRINAHDALSQEDKVVMQQYITRCYGSLTTFNVLLKNDEDRFVGEKGDY